MNTQVSVGDGDEVAQIHLDGENVSEIDLNNKRKTGTKVIAPLKMIRCIKVYFKNFRADELFISQK